MADDYEALLADYNTLRKEYAQMRGEMVGHQPRKQGGGCVNALVWLVTFAALGVFLLAAGPDILVSYGIVSPETMAGVLHIATPAPQGARPTPGTARTGGSTTGGASYTTSGSGGGTTSSAPRIAGDPLPPCSTVQDTTTACVQDQPQPTPTSELPTGTPEPAYVMVTCLTPPGERPCWLPADQAWTPPADVPETPIVLLPDPANVPLVFSDSPCAAWHPPLPYPEECRTEDSN